MGRRTGGTAAAAVAWLMVLSLTACASGAADRGATSTVPITGPVNEAATGQASPRSASPTEPNGLAELAVHDLDAVLPRGWTAVRRVGVVSPDPDLPTWVRVGDDGISEIVVVPATYDVLPGALATELFDDRDDLVPVGPYRGVVAAGAGLGYRPGGAGVTVHVPACGLIRLVGHGVSPDALRAAAATASCTFAGGNDIDPPPGFHRSVAGMSPEGSSVAFFLQDSDHQWAGTVELIRAAYVDFDVYESRRAVGPPTTVAGHPAWNELYDPVQPRTDPTRSNFQLGVDAGAGRIALIHVVAFTWPEIDALAARLIDAFDTVNPPARPRPGAHVLFDEPDGGATVTAQDGGASVQVRWREPNGGVVTATVLPQLPTSRTSSSGATTPVLGVPVGADASLNAWQTVVEAGDATPVWLTAVGVPTGRLRAVLRHLRFVDDATWATYLADHPPVVPGALDAP